MTGSQLYPTTITNNVGIGTQGLNIYALDVSGNLNTNADATINGVRVGLGGGNSNLNTVVGSNALTSNTTGTGNIAIGPTALLNNTIGNYNVAVGYEALYTNAGGYYNTAIGFTSMLLNAGGNNNTAVGVNSLRSNTSGNYNVAVGVNALQTNTTGTNNVAVGSGALPTNQSGGTNVAIGLQTLQSNISGDSNIAINSGALYSNTTGNYNIGIGQNSLLQNRTGLNNIGLGNSAGVDLSGNSSYNTFLGNFTNISSPTAVYNNSTALGYGAIIDASNQIILGNTSITSLNCQVALTVVSDARDKTNFEPLDAGLNFINEITPVRFDWNQRGGGLEGRKDIGFTAQDLLEVQQKTNINIPNLVDESNPDKYSITNTQLIPILVKAIQELSAKVKTLENPI